MEVGQVFAGTPDRIQAAGDFETHLTLRPGPDQAALARAAGRHGFSYGHIELDGGRTPSQPMFSRRDRGELDQLVSAAYSWVEPLRGEGCEVVRIKVEAAPWNAGVPTTDAEAEAAPAHRYFEHHVKLLLNGRDDLARLAEVARRHAARLSRNARRVRPDGRSERFVTQRCWRMGRPAARRRLDDLLAGLAGWEVLEVEEEYAVHDDNLALDAGWLEVGNDR